MLPSFTAPTAADATANKFAACITVLVTEGPERSRVLGHSLGLSKDELSATLADPAGTPYFSRALARMPQTARDAREKAAREQAARERVARKAQPSAPQPTVTADLAQDEVAAARQALRLEQE